MLNKEDIEKIYLNKKISKKECCEILSLTEYKLDSLLKKYNIPRRYDNRPKLQKINCENIDELKKLAFDMSLSNSYIAKKFGISTSLLHKWFIEYEIPNRNERNNEGKCPEKIILEEKYLKEMLSPKDIGLIFGVSNVTVNNWLKKYNIPLRNKKQSSKTQPYRNKIETTNLKKYGVKYPLIHHEYRPCSKGELNLIETLNSIGFNFKSTRKILDNEYELDGYDENKKVAIEYCGLYWHSEAVLDDKNYHYKKWKECQEKGIKLYTIFEDEWNKDPVKIVNYIKMNNGLGSDKIHARKTTFKEIPLDFAKEFCNQYHIQNSPNINRAYGLEYENNIISVMTFGKHHRDSKKIVMNRFCGINELHVIGGASKLISNASKIIKENIYTWSDNRFSSGNVYEKIGCIKLAESKPDYYWTDKKQKFSKQSRMKSITKQPKEITEKEYNESLGLFRIWDCGKITWVYLYKG